MAWFLDAIEPRISKVTSYIHRIIFCVVVFFFLIARGLENFLTLASVFYETEIEKSLGWSEAGSQ